jgi:hypothetical protein
MDIALDMAHEEVATMPDNDCPQPIEFRLVGNDPGYRVGDDGSVWTCLIAKHELKVKGKGVNWVPEGPWRRMRQTPHRDNHLHVFIRGRNRQVHHLVLEAFVGPCPPGMESRHLNGNPADNRLANLAWGTHKENIADAIERGTRPRGRRPVRAKVTENLVRVIRIARNEGWSQVKIAKRLNVAWITVHRILKDEAWRHVK